MVARELEHEPVVPAVRGAIERERRDDDDRDRHGDQREAAPDGQDQRPDRDRRHGDQRGLLGLEGEREQEPGDRGVTVRPRGAGDEASREQEQHEQRVGTGDVEPRPRLAVGRGEQPDGDQRGEAVAALAPHVGGDHPHDAEGREQRDQAQRREARRHHAREQRRDVEVERRVDEGDELERGRRVDRPAVEDAADLLERAVLHPLEMERIRNARQREYQRRHDADHAGDADTQGEEPPQRYCGWRPAGA